MNMHLAHSHDLALVALSYLVALSASYTALDMGERLSRARAKELWLAATAIILGGGIWSMHFIGMLGLRIGVPIRYDLSLTILSLVIAVAFASLGLFVIFRGAFSTARLVITGTIVGIGIAAMHYTGMAAMRTTAQITYNPQIVFMSVAVAVGAAIAALWFFAFSQRGIRRKLIAAALMGAAICGMHYTGMAATAFDLAAMTPATLPELSKDTLALTTAGIMLSLMFLALISVVVDRRMEILAHKDGIINAFLSSVDLGVLVVDRSMKILMVNDSLAGLLGSRPDEVRAGADIESIVGKWHDEHDMPANRRRNDLHSLRSRKKWRGLVPLPDGRTIECRHSPMPDGGFVRSFADVSEAQTVQERLKKEKEKSEKEALRIAVLRRVASAANTASGIEEAIEKCLRFICEFMSWQAGHAYSWDGEQKALVPTGLWYVDDTARFNALVAATRETKLSPGLGLPGRVWESRTPLSLRDVSAHEKIPRGKLARELGLTSGFAFPILVGDEVPYVLEFYSSYIDDVDADTFEVVRDIASQVAQVIERTRTGIALAEAKADAESASKAKSQFLAAMSHEIRTPMNGVMGIVELLQAERLSPKHKKMVEMVRQSGDGLLDVINDILDFSKIEAGHMTVEITTFSLGELVENTAASVGSHTKSKTLNVICGFDPAIDWTVKGDPVRVRQILLNLLSNALKFTEVGTISVEATADAVSDDQITVLFEVADTGVGIPHDRRHNLFKAFSQTDYSTTRKFGGTGLGLSICKNLVELMGGEIGCRSVPDEGSIFWFKLPFVRIPPSQRRNIFESYISDLAGLRVLVSGRTLLCRTLNRYLTAVGVDLIDTKSVREAIDSLSEAFTEGRPVDVAIMKSFVGDDSASQFIDALNRRRDVDATKILFVVPRQSAAQLPETRGRSATIVSPVERKSLYDAIAALTDRRVHFQAVSAENDVLDYIPPTVDEAAAQGSLILVAEDNETNTFVIGSQLQRLGYAVEFAQDGREAWNILRRHEGRHSLLVTDCHMPFMDGYELTAKIREREQESEKRLPIVALTANALDGEEEICLAAGMDDYLSKPATLKQFDAVLQKWLPRAGQLRKASATHGAAQTPEMDYVLPPKGAGAPIDMPALAELLGNKDTEYLQKALGVFWKSMEGTAPQLREIVQSRDGRKLQNAAHRAKGAAASAAAAPLTALLKDLESQGQSPDWKIIEGLLPQIDIAFDNLRIFIENYQNAASVDAST